MQCHTVPFLPAHKIVAEVTAPDSISFKVEIVDKSKISSKNKHILLQGRMVSTSAAKLLASSLA